MRHAFALHAALACVLVLPAVTIEPRQGESITQALLRTVRSLEHLAGLQQQLAEPQAVQGSDAIATVLEWTEAPLPSAEEREQLLVDLRNEVNRLQGEYDLVQPSAEPDPAPLAADCPALDPEERGVPPAPTTGLDEGMRALLAAIREPVPERRPTAAAAALLTSGGGRAREAFEPEGYTADALLLARVRYRQGRWQETVDILSRAAGAESVYLRARALERLERHAEALADYRAVIAMPDAGTLAERAREDSEFLEWRRTFTKKLAGAKHE
jgi:hypothetical protein